MKADLKTMLDRQARWQTARRAATWQEKLKQSLAARESLSARVASRNRPGTVSRGRVGLRGTDRPADVPGDER